MQPTATRDTLLRCTIFFCCLLGFLSLSPTRGKSVVALQTDGVFRLHAINGSDTAGDINNDPGVGDPLLNLRVNGHFDPGVTAYGELYLGQTSPNDETVEIGSFYGSSGKYLSPFELKLGQFEMPYGTQPERRSDHAQVQDNPLIGNPLVDPTDHQLGAEFSGDHDYFDWRVALTNGTDESSLNPDRGFGSAARMTLHPLEMFSFSLSGYRAQHSDTTADRGVSTITNDNLFGPSGQTTVGSIKGLQPGESTPYPSLERGLGAQPNVLAIGRDLTAWQGDLNLKFLGEWAFRYGQIEDTLSNLDFTFGSNPATVEWNYYSLEGKHPLPIPGYLAWRWDQLDAETLRNVPRFGQGVNQNGTFDRYQIGYGRQFTNNLRLKVEYVSGEETITNERFEFDGLSFEASLTGFPELSPKNLALSPKNS